MTREQQRRGALEAIERILNRGGERDEVLRAVRAILQRLEPCEPGDRAFLERVALLLSPYLP